MKKPQSQPYTSKKDEQSNATGLVRELLSGKGQTLEEAFENIRRLDTLEWFVEAKSQSRFGARIGIPPEEGVGYWDFAWFSDEYFVVVGEVEYEKPRSEYLPGDGLLEFHIRFGGRLTLMTSRTTPLELNGPSLLVWSLPEGQESEEEIPPQKEKSLTVYFKPEHILRRFIGSTDLIPQNLAKFLINNEDSLNYCTLPLSPEILKVAGSVFSARDRFEGMLWLNYMHAKSEELICTIIETFDQLSDSTSVSFTEREIELLRKAKEIAAMEIENPPTIKEISQQIGTNETKLKQGFRALFGETVFEYRNRKRMDRAKELVLRGEPLSNVADMVGFKHQTSFTTAFKLYFGTSPKEYRKFSKDA